jgi:uncharacterized protein with von Willebrand factor type A (vWA) domain
MGLDALGGLLYTGLKCYGSLQFTAICWWLEILNDCVRKIYWINPYNENCYVVRKWIDGFETPASASLLETKICNRFLKR